MLRGLRLKQTDWIQPLLAKEVIFEADSFERRRLLELASVLVSALSAGRFRRAAEGLHIGLILLSDGRKGTVYLSNSQYVF
jgi:hypothetical protein